MAEKLSDQPESHSDKEKEVKSALLQISAMQCNAAQHWSFIEREQTLSLFFNIW